jgi:cyclic beta-1,2-glucan synthetase
MLQAPLPLASLESEATALAREHGESLEHGRLFSRARVLHSALEENTNRILARLHEGDPEQIRKYSYTQWLLDNGHVLRAALQQISKGLPPRYYRQLPTVSVAPGKVRQPRIAALVDIAVELGTAPVELGRFERFCSAYQTVAPLTIGELWALPTMLRIKLLQEICRTAEEAARMSQNGGRAREIEELTAGIGGCITTLRNIAAIQWELIVERLSCVDAILRTDPAGMYERMDFDTRNDYRDTVERTAKVSRLAECDIADAALRLARKAQSTGRLSREQHVGYYLLGRGLTELLSDLNVRGLTFRKALPALGQQRGIFYVLSLGTVAAALCAMFAVWLSNAGTLALLLIAATALATIPALTLSSNLINTLLSLLRRPRRLPKMDFSAGIPLEQQAIVAMPAMLANYDAIDDSLRVLELNYLGNSDATLQFVLLTDYLDAPTETQPGDQALLDYVVNGLDELNRRYTSEAGQPFALLHRRRRWNEVAGLWMGWERKRGKLVQFNDFLRGEPSGNFDIQRGQVANSGDIRYVITLDADTQLPSNAAARLVGTMAHPLNRAVVNHTTCSVEYGYSIVQPRIEINPTTSSASMFARVYAGDVTLDLYTHAVSDVYQDLFSRGIFAGKGIYDVDAFRATVHSRIPENRVLSHDLLEGLCGRAGLATDIVVLEDYPTSFLAHLKRLHRWVRGDWQLLPWLFGCKPAPELRRFRPGLIGSWQLFDNLRRSLLAPAILALFSLGWLFLPVNPLAFTAVVMIAAGIGQILHALAAFRTSTWRWGTARSSLMNVLTHAGRDLAHWILMLAFLPVEALVVLDAVARTLYRLAVSRRNLLEWSTAAEVARDVSADRGEAVFWRRMWAGPAWAGLNALVFLFVEPAIFLPAAVLLLLWALSPAIAFRISRLEQKAPRPLRAEDRLWLRRVARGTWRFFEQQVGPATHWLPPDNIQLEPIPQVAQQTSPTNIGFALLSSVAAYDLGYTSLRECVYNLHHSLESILYLEKHRGHLYNWYSLTERYPLTPRYVSTVDSGNLVAAMIVVRESLLEIANSTISVQPVLNGLEDDLGVMRDKLESLLLQHKRMRPPARLLSVLEDIGLEIQDSKSPVLSVRRLAQEDSDALNNALLETIDDENIDWTNDEIREFRTYVGSFTRRSAAALNEFRELFPWTVRLAEWAESGGDEKEAELIAVVDRELAASPLNELPTRAAKVLEFLEDFVERQDDAAPERSSSYDTVKHFREEMAHSVDGLDGLLEEIRNLAATLANIVTETDFSFLYNGDRNLFHVGYRVDSGELDSSFYDLLASEARLASFIAIAKGDVPPKHWIHLGRPLTSIKGLRVLLSWSATSFEYLMPRLFMETPRFGLLAQSCRGAVKQQMAFGRRHRVPWGISESGYHHFDQHGRYQYQAFGIPRLGLKWDQGERLVISSYSGFLALPFDHSAAIENARQIQRLGGRGELGFFEALDFGAASVTHRSKPKIVQSYMAHHQGMSLAAIANLLTGDRLVERFHRDPRIASTEYLLYEQLPLRARTQPLETFEAPLKQAEPLSVAIETWSLDTSDTTAARSVTMLANTRLSSFVTALGGGNLNWRGNAITRWMPQVDGMNGGSLLYIRDLDSDALWSPGLDADNRSLSIICSPDSIEFRDTRHGLLVREQIVVAPFSDLEVRKVSITNDGNRPRRLMVCAYSEPVLTDARSDARHPLFSKMFVEGEFHEERETLLFRRRARAVNDPSLCLGCKAVTQPGSALDLQFETDRLRFIGRTGSRAKPAALQAFRPQLRCRADDTLDPVAVIGFRITVPARDTFHGAFITGAGDDEVEVLRNLDQFESVQAVDWTIGGARRLAQQELMRLEVTSEDVKRACELFGNLLAPPRPDANRVLTMSSANEGQSHLWRHGISGDRPLILVVISDSINFSRLESLIRALAVGQARGMAADVVFLDESDSAYAHPTHDRLQKIIQQYLRRTATNRQFGTYIVPAYSIDEDSRRAFAISSNLAFDLRLDDWHLQLRQQQRQQAVIPGFLPQPSSPVRRDPITPVTRPSNLLLDNGLGGVSRDSLDYVLYLEDGDTTPAPWCNILANADFGTLISESGSAFTWYRNSSEYALTTWSNDPVLDRTGEAIYIRDEETGLFWSPVPGPARASQPYVVRHGTGFSRFEHASEGLQQRLTCYVDPEEPVKIVRLYLQNKWPRARRLTITYAAEWRLGLSGRSAGLHLLPRWDAEENTMFVRNGFSTNYPQARAFLSSNLAAHGVTFDGDEFLGTSRSWNSPAGLRAIGLSGRVSPCAHPLAAYQVHVSLTEGESCELHFILGAGRDQQHAAALSERFRLPSQAQDAYHRLEHDWTELLSQTVVDTPDAALNAMLNRWLPYQVISSRLNGRLGFYQASGGLGFRDQLQDVLALLHYEPERTAAHITRAAAVQFEEGDVLHWWHEDPLRGVRTRCSDDLLWLPYVVSRYIEVTRDFGLLEQDVPFLTGLPLAEAEHERYAEFRHGQDTDSIYEHCCRAIDARMAFGKHGLPPIGTGDWCDGYSRVGIKGEGESVWMAWFLIDVCRRFEPICRLRKDAGRAAQYRHLRMELQKNVEQSGWSGDWYVRGYYDDGSVLGGPDRRECRIDLIAQTWAVIAGGDSERQKQAMSAAKENLIDSEHHLIKLLAPPFHSGRQDPGYIKGYPPGVRENGGQYNHAAAWALLAAAKSGDGELAYRWLTWLNPLSRSTRREDAEHYRIEPYVVAGDIYSSPPFTGRGGWSWYTGSAAWIYRVAIENVLGIRRRGNRLYFRSCLPDEWEDLAIAIRYKAARYRIRIHRPGLIDGVNNALVEDGRLLPGTALRLQEIGEHDIHVFADATAWDTWRTEGDRSSSREHDFASLPRVR